MTWITILWPMATAACVTMGLIHLRTGLRRTPGAAHLLFSLNAFVMAVFSCLELASTRDGSPAQFLELQRWLDIMNTDCWLPPKAFGADHSFKISVASAASCSILRQSDSQNTGIEHIKADLGVACAQGTARPLALKLAEHVLPLRDGQATPFHFGHEQSLAVVRVGRDQVQLDACGLDARQTLCLPDIICPSPVTHVGKTLGSRALPSSVPATALHRTTRCNSATAAVIGD